MILALKNIPELLTPPMPYMPFIFIFFGPGGLFCAQSKVNCDLLLGRSFDIHKGWIGTLPTPWAPTSQTASDPEQSRAIQVTSTNIVTSRTSSLISLNTLSKSPLLSLVGLSTSSPPTSAAGDQAILDASTREVPYSRAWMVVSSKPATRPEPSIRGSLDLLTLLKKERDGC